MARMIDPSGLEGEELFNWYRRSPADVEAEREAARQAQYDAFVKSIGEASGSQNDSSPQRVEPNPSGLSELGASDGEFIPARFSQPLAPPAIPASGLRVGPPVDARGGPQIGAAPGGFFGAHDYSSALGGYYTDLPVPLNTVSSKANPNWWELGDGSLASTAEVERIYAEQQRRLKGQDDPPPPTPTRVVDNLPDGRVPRADQVPKGQRELDPTCAPFGGWERDPNFDNYSQHTKQYEAQITRAPGLDYVVRIPGEKPVKFDGCAVWDPQHPLLEAKGPGYAALLPKATQWGFMKGMRDKAISQAGRQADAAHDRPVEWHIAEPGALPFFERVTMRNQPPIVPQLTRPDW